MPRIKDLVSWVLLKLGYSINAKSKKILAQKLAEKFGDAAMARRAAKCSKSQLGQDLLALLVQGANQPGYFVEFGAADGIGLSNSYLLEKEFGWKGILAEPARNWQKALKKNRSCHVDFRCVYSSTGDRVKFEENYLGELSGISEFKKESKPGLLDKEIASYEVDTISLMDLLDFYQAPKEIAFLCMDTEGSEFEILNNFDFEKYKFKVISVEHNFLPNRELIKNLLEQKGYTRVFTELSEFDDWYVSDVSGLERIKP